MSFLNLKKIKKKSNYHRFKQNTVQSGKVTKYIHYSFDPDSSFFSKALYNEFFSILKPVYNSKLSVLKRDMRGCFI